MSSTLIPCALFDECLYSLAATYSSRWHEGTRKAAALVLGSPTRLARDFTSKLDDVAELLPKALDLTGRDLALHHSSLPLHLPFVEPAERERLISLCCRESGIHLRLGIAPAKAGSAGALRYCDDCRRSDVTRLGRAYWHRLHQLPGVIVCPEHNRALTVSTVRPIELGSGFIEASDAQADYLMPVPAAAFADARWIARAIAMLLERQTLSPGRKRLQRFYVQEAAGRYSMKNGSIAVAQLTEDFIARFSVGLLESIGCVDLRWIKGMFRHPRGHQQPLRHLLLCRFLGIEVLDALVRANAVSCEGTGSTAHPNRIRSLHRLAQLRPEKRLAWREAKRVFGPQAREEASEVYSWLHRNDREWLLATRGNRRPRTPNRTRWATIDAELVGRIRDAKANILREAGPRASRNYLARRVGHWSWLAKDHPLLPLSTAAIKNSAESAACFARRRIEQFVRQHGASDAAWRVRVACGISAALAKTPQVEDALRSACDCTAQKAFV